VGVAVGVANMSEIDNFMPKPYSVCDDGENRGIRFFVLTRRGDIWQKKKIRK